MFPVLLRLGPLTIYTYGAMVSLGGILAFAFLHARRRSMGFARDEHFWVFVNVVLLGGALGGRVLHVLEYVPLSSPDFWDLALSPRSGFSVMGAFLAVAIGVWVLCRRLGIRFLAVWDHFSLVLPLWHFFGRLGCLGAGCCHGRPTDVRWAVTYGAPFGSLVSRELMGKPLHPTQLYEAVPELGLAAVFYFLAAKPLERGRIPAGTMTAAFLAFYSALRFVNEYFRADTVPLPGLGLTAAQALSLAYFAAALGLAAWARRSSHVPGPS